MLTSCPTRPSSVANAGNWLDQISQRVSGGQPVQADPDLWFANSPTELELAKAFCAACPARGPCLAAALIRQEPCGVLGRRDLRPWPDCRRQARPGASQKGCHRRVSYPSVSREQY